MRAAVIDPAPPVRDSIALGFHKPLKNEEEPRRTRGQTGTNAATSDFLYQEPQAGRAAHAASRMEQAMPKTAQQTLARQLCDSVDGLQKQVEKVEFWASALTGFTQPIPDYDPDTSAVAKYVKSGRPPRKRRRRRAAAQAAAKPASA